MSLATCVLGLLPLRECAMARCCSTIKKYNYLRLRNTAQTAVFYMQYSYTIDSKEILTNHKFHKLVIHKLVKFVVYCYLCVQIQ